MENEKRDMKWALDLAIDAAEDKAAEYREIEDEESADLYTEAAYILRNGGMVVEKSKEFNYMCKSCGELYEHPVQYCTECISCSWSIERLNIPRTMKWTVREKIKIITAESKQTFDDASIG